MKGNTSSEMELDQGVYIANKSKGLGVIKDFLVDNLDINDISFNQIQPTSIHISPYLVKKNDSS